MSVELAECSRIFRELETQRIDLLAELAEWPVSHLSFRPATGKWPAVDEAGPLDLPALGFAPTANSSSESALAWVDYP